MISFERIFLLLCLRCDLFFSRSLVPENEQRNRLSDCDCNSPSTENRHKVINQSMSTEGLSESPPSISKYTSAMRVLVQVLGGLIKTHASCDKVAFLKQVALVIVFLSIYLLWAFALRHQSNILLCTAHLNAHVRLAGILKLNLIKRTLEKTTELNSSSLLSSPPQLYLNTCKEYEREKRQETTHQKAQQQSKPINAVLIVNVYM